mgnify:CR=1 FL=1
MQRRAGKDEGRSTSDVERPSEHAAARWPQRPAPYWEEPHNRPRSTTRTMISAAVPKMK